MVDENKTPSAESENKVDGVIAWFVRANHKFAFLAVKVKAITPNSVFFFEGKQRAARATIQHRFFESFDDAKTHTLEELTEQQESLTKRLAQLNENIQWLKNATPQDVTEFNEKDFKTHGWA